MKTLSSALLFASIPTVRSAHDPNNPDLKEHCMWRDGVFNHMVDGVEVYAPPNASREDRLHGIILRYTDPEILCCGHGYSGSLDGHQGGCPDARYTEELGDLSVTYLECCFPKLRRMLMEPAPAWLAEEIERLSPDTLGLDWRPEAWDAFETECASRPENSFVRFRARGQFDIETSVDLGALAVAWNGGEGYFKAILRALRILRFWAPPGALDDLDIFISGIDCVIHPWPVPVYGQTRMRGLSSVGVFPHEWLLTYLARRQAHYVTLDLPWEEKVPKVFWRGNALSAWCQLYDLGLGLEEQNVTPDIQDRALEPCLKNFTGSPQFTLRSFSMFPRGRLAQLAEFAPDVVDAKFTSADVNQVEASEKFAIQRYLEARGMMQREFFDTRHHSYNRYLISVDYSDRLYWLLQLNSVVLVAQINLERAIIGGNLFRPFEHYLPIKADLSDVLEKVRWAESHPEEAAKIAERGSMLARRLFSHEDMLHIMYRVLEKHVIARREALAQARD